MKNALNISLWILLFASFFALLSFSSVNFNDRTCNELSLKILDANEHPLINDATIQKTLSDNGFRVEGQKLNEIPVDRIEQKLNAISQIKESKVFTNVNGDLEILVKQMSPVARVFNSNGDSYYVDENGSAMELSALHSARLVSISSEKNIDFRQNDESNLKFNNEIMALVNFINQDSFWKSQIVQIHIDKNNEIELTPRVGNHKILIGNGTNLRAKFDKLWAFYRNCEKGNYWNAFSLVNLKFKDQIVCTKK